jgi:hypothetical protein
MHVLLAGDLDPVVGDGKIEMAFFGLNLVPRHRHERGVEVQLRQTRQD